MSETQAEYIYAVSTSPPPDPSAILELLNYLTSTQITRLTEALAAVAHNGGFGQVRVVIKNGMACFIASEVSIKLPME
jgi:hypothetical protein